MACLFFLYFYFENKLIVENLVVGGRKRKGLGIQYDDCFFNGQLFITNFYDVQRINLWF